MNRVLILVVGFLSVACYMNAQSIHGVEQSSSVQMVNEIRAKGCKCGRRWYNAAGPLVWNDTLAISAQIHADHMKQHKIFEHFSKDGKNIGQRADKVGYNWQFIGENIGFGHLNLEEVIAHWVKSPSHCTLLMDKRMEHMAISRSGNYWVFHAGKPMANDVRNKATTLRP